MVALTAAILEQAVSDLGRMAKGKSRPRGTKWAFTRKHFQEFFEKDAPTVIHLAGLRLDPDAVLQKLQPQIDKVPL